MMQAFVRSSRTTLTVCAVVALIGCGGDDTPAPNSETEDAGRALHDAAQSDAGTGLMSADAAANLGRKDSGSASIDSDSSATSDAAFMGAPTSDAATDSGVTDVCGSALFCEKFDDYTGVSAIADKQKFGPWRATLQTGATMGLDGKHKKSGANALHVHIDNAATAGGRLFADGAQPIFTGNPTHLYGRMMMYIDPNGTSVHWTFFGANGKAESTSPATGRSASYIMSSLPKKGVNTYSFVYGLSALGSDGYHDCSSQSNTSMPSDWACVSFELDSVTRKLRMYKDGAPEPILSIDDHGKACVAPTSVTSPWYGPAISQLFVGAWSFHAMDAPLDVWIDDLVVDTKPVSCASP